MKNKLLFIMMIVLLLAIILAVFILRNKEEEVPEIIVSPETLSTEETLPALPDSVLYYGEIQKIQNSEDGTPARLVMDSEPYGPYIMNLSENTCYVDSGKGTALDVGDFREGDRVYVFHSPIAARSMPPQSTAFVLLKNMPMDVSCGMYHEVEQIQMAEEGIQITTDNGSKVLGINGETNISAYAGEPARMDQIQEGSFIIAWYWDRGETVKRVSRVMLLP